MSRYATNQQSVTVGTGVGSSDEIPYGDYEKGSVFVPSGSSITQLTWHASDAQGGTFAAAYNEAGTTAVTQTVAAGRTVPIPDALAGARAIKAVGDAAGTIHVSLKE